MTAAIAKVQILSIVNPGVKKAVIAKTIADPTSLPIICQAVPVPLALFDPSICHK